MDRDAAAAYYNETKQKGTGAKLYRHGLGFNINNSAQGSVQTSQTAQSASPLSQPISQPRPLQPPPMVPRPPMHALPHPPQYMTAYSNYGPPAVIGSGASGLWPLRPAGVPYAQPYGQPPPPRPPPLVRPPIIQTKPIEQSVSGHGLILDKCKQLSTPNVQQQIDAEQHAGITCSNGVCDHESKPERQDMKTAMQVKQEQEEQLQEQQWTGVQTENGQVYYNNSVTGESTWTKPAGFAGRIHTSTPVPQNTQVIPGTHWVQVECVDGRTYWYHNQTQQTSWTMPDDVKQAQSSRLTATATTIHPTTLAPNVSSTNEAHNAQLSKCTASKAPQHGKISQGQEKKLTRKEMSEQFKQLLNEKQINPFSRFEDKVTELQSDPRYPQTLGSRLCKQLFDEYCREYAARKTQAAKQTEKQIRCDFESLMKEIVSSQQLPEQRKQTNDDAGGTDVSDELEEGEARSEKSDSMDSIDSHNEALMKQNKSCIDSNTTLQLLEQHFGSDDRWKAASSSVRGQVYNSVIQPLVNDDIKRQKYITKHRINKFKKLLKRVGVDSSSRWSAVYNRIHNKSQYHAVKQLQPEAIFQQYIREVGLSGQQGVQHGTAGNSSTPYGDDTIESQQAQGKARQQRAAKQAGRTAYQNLLIERVKHCTAQWQEWEAKLNKDPQGRGTEPILSSDERQDLFHHHIRTLYSKALQQYTDMLDETLGKVTSSVRDVKGSELPDVLGKWQAAQKVLENDVRFKKLPEQDRKQEWMKYTARQVGSPSQHYQKYKHKSYHKQACDKQDTNERQHEPYDSHRSQEHSKKGAYYRDDNEEQKASRQSEKYDRNRDRDRTRDRYKDKERHQERGRDTDRDRDYQHHSRAHSYHKLQKTSATGYDSSRKRSRYD